MRSSPFNYMAIEAMALAAGICMKKSKGSRRIKVVEPKPPKLPGEMRNKPCSCGSGMKGKICECKEWSR